MPGRKVPATCGWHGTCSSARVMARSEGRGDLVDILVYVLWIAVLVVILQRA